MNIKHSSHHRINDMMQIVADAQHYLFSLKIDQWQDGYPSVSIIENDINNNESYSVVNNRDEIMGMTMFTTRPEPTYFDIDGKWLTDKNATYGVIHRMAVSNSFRGAGVAKFLFHHFEQQLISNKIGSMRIDTHKDNKGMQQLISQMGYQYCGVIVLERGAERLAYEKVF